MKSNNINERLYLDGSSIKKPSNNGKAKISINSKRFWYLTVEEDIGYKCSIFVKAKPEMIEAVAGQIMKYQMSENKVKYIRMDNAGENKGLEKVMNSPNNNLSITTKYTARNIPQ